MSERVDLFLEDPAARSAVAFIIHKLFEQSSPKDTLEYIDQEMDIRREAIELGIWLGPTHDIDMCRAFTRARAAVNEIRALTDPVGITT